MIISKKKLDELINRAVEEVQREHYLHERIERVDREFHERIDDILRHVCELERELSELKEEKRLKKKHKWW